MKNFERVGFTIFMIAGGLVVAGNYFNLPILTYAAFVVLGLMACIGGIRVIVRGETVMGKTKISDTRKIRRYTGLSAYLIGAVIFLVGLLLIGLSAAGMLTPGGITVVLSKLVESDFGISIVLGVAGLIVIAFGIVRMRSGSGASPGAYSRLAEFGIKTGGVVSIVVGVGIILIALGFLFAPELLRDLFAQVVDFGKGLFLGQ